MKFVFWYAPTFDLVKWLTKPAHNAQHHTDWFLLWKNVVKLKIGFWYAPWGVGFFFFNSLGWNSVPAPSHKVLTRRLDFPGVESRLCIGTLPHSHIADESHIALCELVPVPMRTRRPLTGLGTGKWYKSWVKQSQNLICDSQSQLKHPFSWDRERCVSPKSVPRVGKRFCNGSHPNSPKARSTFFTA